jgi:hypothetical protein
MKKLLLFFMCIEIFIATDAYACKGSNCKECPDGFAAVTKCCGTNGCVLQEYGDYWCKKAGLKGYGNSVRDCCNSDLTECTGYVKICPKCGSNIRSRPRQR